MAKQAAEMVTVYLNEHVKRASFVDADTGLEVTHEPQTVPVEKVGWRTRSLATSVTIKPADSGTGILPVTDSEDHGQDARATEKEG